MNYRRGYYLLILLSGAFLLSEQAEGQIEQRGALVSGGATAATGGDLVLQGSVGQPVIGPTGGTGMSLGQGFWYGVAGGGASGVEDSWRGDEGVAMLECLPNPVTTQATFRIVLPESGQISLRLYDRLGRVQRDLAEGKQQEGTLLLETAIEGLETGVYTAELRTENGRVTTQVIVLH